MSKAILSDDKTFMMLHEQISPKKINYLNILYFVILSVLILSFFFSNTQFIGDSRDYDNYILIFSGQDFGGILEFFYRILMIFTKDYKLIIFTILLLALGLKILFLAKYTLNTKGLFVFILYYSLIATWIIDYTQFRNGLCLSILMYAIYAVFNKQAVTFYLLIAIAITAHWSALPFLLLYPYIHNSRLRMLGNAIGALFLLIYIFGYSDSLILYIRSFELGQKIGNDDSVNLINSLSLTFSIWFLLSRLNLCGMIQKRFDSFFFFAFLQYAIFVMFSLPVLAFRVLEMYFFLMVTTEVFVQRERNDLLIFMGKILVLLYLAFYYHVLFGVVNA